MDKILNLDSVRLYNELYGLETLHPLVSVINLNEATRGVDRIRLNYGVYALYLKMEKSCDIKYGRQTYDYEDGTIVCFAPGQIAETTPTREFIQTNVYGLISHPDLLHGTSLGKSIKKYTFFSYEINEALHVSDEEREIVLDCLHIIQKELRHDRDKHCCDLIVMYVELLLGYCMRFYERQFVTRAVQNRDVLTRFEHFLDEYFEGLTAERKGLPTVKGLADKLCLSPNYFGDMLKKETGKTPREYIQARVIEMAKERVANTDASITEIAYSLGFRYPQHFCRLFKEKVGCSPSFYRARVNS